MALNRLARLPRIPDLLTTANLCCGVASILLASQGQLTIACGLIFLAAVFDVFDGLAARALGGSTPLGAQLDSLADMVSFGVAPGILAYHLMLMGLSADWAKHLVDGAATPQESDIMHALQCQQIISGATALVISIASAWRLAKFNIDTRQSGSFLGLPTPANALFWASMMLGPSSIQEDEYASMIAWAFNPWILGSMALILSFLMLSELPLPSLKFKHKGWKGNEVIFLLMGMGAVLVLLYGVLAVPLILIIYLLSPLWGKLFPKHPA